MCVCVCVCVCVIACTSVCLRVCSVVICIQQQIFFIMFSKLRTLVQNNI